jgi:hypothetical protein
MFVFKIHTWWVLNPQSNASGFGMHDSECGGNMLLASSALGTPNLVDGVIE